MLPIPITLAAPTATTGGLLANAGPIGPGWERGVQFAGTQCIGPFIVGECPTDTDLKPLSSTSGPWSFRPYDIGAAVACTTLGERASGARANAALDAVREFAIGRELLTGEASTRDVGPGGEPNPALVTHVTLDLGDDFTSVVALIGCLDQKLNNALYGRAGAVHLPAGLLAAAMAAQVLWRDGVRLRTPSGHLVIASSGYDGRAPDAVAPPTAGAPLWAYATGPVYTEVGSRVTLQSVDRSLNTDEARAEEHALAVFDPCVVIAGASAAVTACP